MPHIRTMTAADIDGVSEVRVRGWQSAYAGIVPRTFLDGMTVEDDARQRRAWFSDPRRTGGDLVAVDGRDRVVGWAAFGPYRGELPGPVGEVYALYVLPELIGTGIGRALLDAVHAHPGSRRFDTLALWVLRANARARRFYERAGYTADGGEQSDTYDGMVLTEVRYRRVR